MNLRTLSTQRLKAFVQSHGKVVNQRLVAIEKAGFETFPAYQYISSRLSRDMTSISRSGHLKLNIAVRGKTRNELLEIATIIEHFEKAKTSTIKGIRIVNKDIKKKTEERTGVKFTDEQFGKFWSSLAVDSFKTKFGSGQVVKMLSKYGIEEAFNIIEGAELRAITTLFEIEDVLKQEYGNSDDYKF